MALALKEPAAQRGIRHLGHNVKQLKCRRRGTDKGAGEVRGPRGVETELGLERQTGFEQRHREGKPRYLEERAASHVWLKRAWVLQSVGGFRALK